MAQLTQKEKMLLEEEKAQEQLCIEKYQHGAESAECSELKQLFTTLGSAEQQHLNTINSILGGQVPMMGQGGNQGSGQGGQGGGQKTQTPNIGGTQSQNFTGKSKGSNKDSMLCHDALATEKYVSGLYNTSIFEFRDTNIRQALNHIQKEEQEHGEQIFNYMSSHGYYNMQ